MEQLIINYNDYISNVDPDIERITFTDWMNTFHKGSTNEQTT